MQQLNIQKQYEPGGYSYQVEDLHTSIVMVVEDIWEMNENGDPRCGIQILFKDKGKVLKLKEVPKRLISLAQYLQ